MREHQFRREGLTIESWRTLKELKSSLIPLPKKIYHRDPSVIYILTPRWWIFWLWVQIILHFRNLTEIHFNWSLSWDFGWAEKYSCSVKPVWFILFVSLSPPVSQMVFHKPWGTLDCTWPLTPVPQKSDLKFQGNLEQTVFCQSSKENVNWLS